ncbi:protein OBERON 1-like [Abrus precatorius]|uniref:Protein OBERON 1-like n=1 Tax=Abrus precatorius TaxID=3816 RepID=A0A8B8M881_ABRPR|nr:protein OBERON 1-like [Abrus precatorius]
MDSEEENAEIPDDNNEGADGDNNDRAHVEVRKLPPVAPEQFGEGLPYAPENWPKPGDIWGWRTGKKVSTTGHFLNRYLYLPSSLCGISSRGRTAGQKRKQCFASKVAVKRYLTDTFPDVKVYEFFGNFSWMIPCVMPGAEEPGAEEPIPQPAPAVSLVESSHLKQIESNVVCKAGNKECSSLSLEEREKYSPGMPCNICCAVADFCRDCSCILCSRNVDSAYGGYSYIKCLVKTNDNICGHVAHMECALRDSLAGTAGGDVAIDAEYYCRRCKGRTDLVSHVKKLIESCTTTNLDSDIRKNILNLCTSLLENSKKDDARKLLIKIGKSVQEVKCETNRQDTSLFDDGCEGLSVESPLDVPIATEPCHLSAELRLEIETDCILRDLKSSQEYEYKWAAGKLNEQKKLLQDLHRQLEDEAEQLRVRPSSAPEGLEDSIRQKKEQIEKETMKFEEMKKVDIGFARTSKDILQNYFGLWVRQRFN